MDVTSIFRENLKGTQYTKLTLKKACFLTSSASLSLDPKRRSGFRLRSCNGQNKEIASQSDQLQKQKVSINKGNDTMAHTLLMMAMDSVDKKRGYLTSSFTILSNTSSSSSPGNGDWKMKQAEILMTNLYVWPNNSLYFNVKAGQNVTHQIYSKILGMNFKSYTII